MNTSEVLLTFILVVMAIGVGSFVTSQYLEFKNKMARRAISETSQNLIKVLIENVTRNLMNRVQGNFAVPAQGMPYIPPMTTANIPHRQDQTRHETARVPTSNTPSAEQATTPVNFYVQQALAQALRQIPQNDVPHNITDRTSDSNHNEISSLPTEPQTSEAEDQNATTNEESLQS